MIKLLVYNDSGTVELDTYGDENINITYGIDDLRNIESKVGDYSKVFDLPATKNNNRYFGYLHDLQSDVSQYDTLNGQRCELFINNISVFEGLLYLNEIVKLDKETKYKVNLLGESVRLIEVLGDATIADLDFSEMANNFTNANITSISGVTTTAGTTTQSVLYSLIQNLGIVGDSGGNIIEMISSRNVQPFIRMHNIVNKIFNFAGFQYESNFFDSTLKQIFMDTGLSDFRIEGDSGTAQRHIQFNQNANVSSTPTIPHLFQTTLTPTYTFQQFPTLITTAFSFDNVHDIATSFTQIPFNVEPSTTTLGNPNDAGNIMSANGLVTSPANDFSVSIAIRLKVFATENETITVIARQTAGGTGTVTDHTLTEFVMPDIQNSIFFQAGGSSLQYINYSHISAFSSQDIILNAGDTLDFRIKKSGGDAWIARYQHNWNDLSGNVSETFIPGANDCAEHINDSNTTKFYAGGGAGTLTEISSANAMCLDLDIDTQNAGNTLSVIPTGLTPNAIHTRMHDNHGEVKLADILKDLVKMFNLVIENRDGILKIEPYNDFITSGSSKDWSSKIDITEIVQNYERVPSKITWRYNNDEDDLVLNAYKQTTGDEYGSMSINLPVDYVDEKEIQLEVFSAMAYVHLSSGLRYSTCYGFKDGVYEVIENKPRLIFKNSTSLVSTSINDITGIYTNNSYRAMSHFDKYPGNMTSFSESLNFGYTQNTLIAQSFSATPRNLYNEYWFNYINERYTAERVLVKCKAYLNETDIQSFSFADTITIQNQQFRVVKIEYSAGQSGLAKLQMLKL